MALETRIQIRMSDIEKEQLEEQANESGFTVSDYMRRLIENDSGRED